MARDFEHPLILKINNFIVTHSKRQELLGLQTFYGKSFPSNVEICFHDNRSRFSYKRWRFK